MWLQMWLQMWRRACSNVPREWKEHIAQARTSERTHSVDSCSKRPTADPVSFATWCGVMRPTRAPAAAMRAHSSAVSDSRDSAAREQSFRHTAGQGWLDPGAARRGSVQTLRETMEST